MADIDAPLAWRMQQDGYLMQINQLRDENTKLRQELAMREESEQEKVIKYLQQECVDWEDKYRALAAENAKLLEVSVKMARALGVHPDWCERKCALEFECRYEEVCPICAAKVVGE